MSGAMAWLDLGQIESQKQLTANEMAIRDKFVSEYLKDYDAYNACLRMGFASFAAMEWAKKFMEDYYVLNNIQLLRQHQVDTNEAIDFDKALIIQTYRQAMQHGPFASRIMAANGLAKVRGLDKPTTADAEGSLIEAFKELAGKLPV
ncbi:terminase small subunit [Pseudomonas phage MiCath]|uniref:Terminase small subunit n=1 Tax=Pseudomonas phage MiCath TaxID=3003729 RepID=A0AAE9VJ31_9CAUD|nr:terminase small subunit [Pseudomonas phage MiCath]WAX22356.1 terminase small subunit [Pseudomonas phage MiCath]